MTSSNCPCADRCSVGPWPDLGGLSRVQVQADASAGIFGPKHRHGVWSGCINAEISTRHRRIEGDRLVHIRYGQFAPDQKVLWLKARGNPLVACCSFILAWPNDNFCHQSGCLTIWFAKGLLRVSLGPVTARMGLPVPPSQDVGLAGSAGRPAMFSERVVRGHAWAILKCRAHDDKGACYEHS